MASLIKDFEQARRKMVEQDLKPRGITDARVIHAFETVPRHEFVDASFKFRAYDDHPLPIGDQQTISQPYVVAAMAQSLKIKETDTILDIGTGCGYQAAIFATICKRVYSVERIATLVSRAKKTLDTLGFHNVLVKLGDGFLGWPEYAPYDGIAVAAYTETVPDALTGQLKVGGRLVLPLGTAESQSLCVYEKMPSGELKRFVLGKCAFVPMVRG